MNNRLEQRQPAQPRRVGQQGEQRVDRMQLHRADDHRGEIRLRSISATRISAVCPCPGARTSAILGLKLLLVAAHEGGALDHRQGLGRGVLTRVEALDRLAAGVDRP